MYLVEKISKHAAPHLHNCLEMILVTKGTLEIGMGQELFHMEKGDMAVIFPDVIHHCQVFGEGIKKALHFTGLSGRYSVLERPRSEVNGRPFFS